MRENVSERRNTTFLEATTISLKLKVIQAGEIPDSSTGWKKRGLDMSNRQTTKDLENQD